MKERRKFEVVWTTPAGDEIARWKFLQGGPTPEGFKSPHPNQKLIETHYMDGEFVYSTEIGPPLVPPL